MKAILRYLVSAMTVLLVASCSKHEAPVPPASAPAAAAAVVGMGEYQVPAGIAAGGACALDAINGGPVTGITVASGTDAMFAGWMGDAKGNVPPDAQFVLKGAEKSYSVAVSGGGERPDVAKALGSEGLKLSGYNLVTKLSGVLPGDYELMVMHGGGTPVACMLNVKLNVGG